MSNIKRICVFCGSSPGLKPEYVSAAAEMGRALASKNIGLVYGGGKVGLMGAVANAALDAGGEVTGVIPGSLVQKEVAHLGLTDLRVVETMHERKALMASLSDGFIAMPGGLGTIEEFFEIVTWAQLGFHNKPCGLLNVSCYYDHAISFLDHAVDEMFLQSGARSLILADETPDGLLRKFEKFSPPCCDKAGWALSLSDRLIKNKN